MTTEPNFAPSDKITYCFTSGPVENLMRLHRAWAPYGSGWLTACDDEDTALSLPDGVTPDSRFFVICRKCFPPPEDPPEPATSGLEPK